LGQITCRSKKFEHLKMEVDDFFIEEAKIVGYLVIASKYFFNLLKLWK